MSTSIDFTPLIGALTPIVVAVVGGLIAAAIKLAAAEFAKLTGVRLDQAALDRVTSAVQAETGGLIAEATGNFATTSITVGSPIVASIATKIIAALPDEIARLNLSSDQVSQMVLGEIGHLQAPGLAAVQPAPKAA